MDSRERSDIADDARGGRGTEPMPRRSRDLLAPRLARTILLAALLSYTLITMLNILSTTISTTQTVVALGSLGAILGLQLKHSAAGANRMPLRVKSLTLSVQALLTYVPFTVFHTGWGSMAGFLAGSVLLLLRPRTGWTLYGLVGLSMLVPPLLDRLPVLDVIYVCQSTLLTGLVTYGLSRLNELVSEVHAARGELARMAVTKERLRFARDLHDLLGFSLSAITLKSELIHRLIPAHPQRAMNEIQEVLAVSRESLADVRRVASGFQNMSLEQEISSAQSVLNSADIGVDVMVSLTGISPQSDTVLATVLREAVTNLLRHSRAGHCTIHAVQRAGRVSLLVINDGIEPGYRDPSPHSGSGLGNLEARVRAIGGEVEAAGGADRTFRLRAEVPSHPSAAAASLAEEIAEIRDPAA